MLVPLLRSILHNVGVVIDLFIRREERQLERRFGEEWRRYTRRVRRWL